MSISRIIMLEMTAMFRIPRLVSRMQGAAASPQYLVSGTLSVKLGTCVLALFRVWLDATFFVPDCQLADKSWEPPELRPNLTFSVNPSQCMSYQIAFVIRLGTQDYYT
jgi:hypothetical protein